MKYRNKHICFYYIGLEHLLLSLHKFVHEALEQNEQVFIFTDNEVEQKSRDIYPHILPLDFKKIILVHDTDGFIAAEKKIDALIASSLEKGYSGICLILQTNNAIRLTSKKAFMHFENNVNTMIHQKPCTVLCIYDINDYFCDRLFIDEDIMHQSFRTHTHKLYKFREKPVNGN